jgi:hypothetical protein
MEPSIVEAKVTPSFRTVIEYIGEFANFSDLKMSIRSGVWERDFCKVFEGVKLTALIYRMVLTSYINPSFQFSSLK